ncbi:MAG: nucleotidyltransferase domain-containing protein [Candidatus Odinarchaeota archaeon]|nr:nucleotidyltransferase domain-containing protein [Candidatus Odinarchaeota archaeon]
MIEEDFKKRAARYIKEILNYINTQFPGKLVSLILFGSSVNGIPTKISDVDLLIVLNDKVTKREMQRIRLRVEKLAVKYRFWSYPQSLFERILRGVKLSTGMFVPFFVTREKDLLSGKFTRIFNVNRVLAFFLSPKSTVLKSIQNNYRVLWGKDVIKSMKIGTQSKIDLPKGLFLNLLQSIAAFFMSPFVEEATKYSLEALKWALYTLRPHLHKRNKANLDDIVNSLIKAGYYPEGFLAFKRLRSNYRNDYRFILMAPQLVTALYIKPLLTLNANIMQFVTNIYGEFRDMIKWR